MNERTQLPDTGGDAAMTSELSSSGVLDWRLHSVLLPLTGRNKHDQSDKIVREE